MQPTRDSSVWRSLAVAFGDGVAFGVGMKLIQPPTRPAAPAPASLDVDAVAGRVEFLERRLAEIERTPAQPAAIGAAAPAMTFDQKVLEAVVNALDARLHEHAGQVERRLTELEAKIAIELQTLHKQDQAVANGLQSMIGQVQEHFEARLAEAHETAAIPRLLEQRTAELYGQLEKVRGEAAAVPGMVKQHTAELRQQMEAELSEFRRSEEEFRDQLRPELESVIREASAIPRLLEQRATELQQHMEGTRQELLGEIHGVRSDAASIAQLVEQRTEELRAEFDAVRAEAAATPSLVEQRSAELQQRIERNRQELHSEIQAARSEAAGLVRPLEDRLKAEVRDGIGRAASLIASSSDAAVQEKLAPIQQRTMQSERALIDLLKGIGAVCREAAQNMKLPDDNGPGGSAPPPEDEKPENVQTVESQPELEREAPPIEAPADPAMPLPSFAQPPQKPSKLWRIPLVSSLAAIGGFAGSYLSMR
jgi:cytochrome c553